MRIAQSFALLLAGVFAGVSFVISCSDSPSNVDAATCDCPAAEPPVPPRIMVVDQTRAIQGNAAGGTSARCPDGSVLLSGSCTTQDINPQRDVTLNQSGFYMPGTEWACEFKNNEATAVTIKASVRCLMPSS